MERRVVARLDQSSEERSFLRWREKTDAKVRKNLVPKGGVAGSLAIQLGSDMKEPTTGGVTGCPGVDVEARAEGVLVISPDVESGAEVRKCSAQGPLNIFRSFDDLGMGYSLGPTKGY